VSAAMHALSRQTVLLCTFCNAASGRPTPDPPPSPPHLDKDAGFAPGSWVRLIALWVPTRWEPPPPSPGGAKKSVFITSSRGVRLPRCVKVIPSPGVYGDGTALPAAGLLLRRYGARLPRCVKVPSTLGLNGDETALPTAGLAA
jgi:hypothetical protein